MFEKSSSDFSCNNCKKEDVALYKLGNLKKSSQRCAQKRTEALQCRKPNFKHEFAATAIYSTMVSNSLWAAAAV